MLSTIEEYTQPYLVGGPENPDIIWMSEGSHLKITPILFFQFHANNSESIKRPNFSGEHDKGQPCQTRGAPITTRDCSFLQT